MSIPSNTHEFVRAFQDYLDCFVVVGGTPTVLYIAKRDGEAPRATKDLDIVILDLADRKREKEFFERFQKYVKDNGYKMRALSSGQSQAYRYTDPTTELAPKIIEIAARRLEGVPASQPAQRLEEFEMSAIVCEAYLVDLLKANTELFTIEDGLALPVPKAAVLIVMKAYAALNLEKSSDVNDRQKYRKHLNDISRLARVLTEDDRLELPAMAYAHLEDLLKRRDVHFDRTRLENCGWKGKDAGKRLEEQLRRTMIRIT